MNAVLHQAEARPAAHAERLVKASVGVVVPTNVLARELGEPGVLLTRRHGLHPERFLPVRCGRHSVPIGLYHSDAVPNQ